MREIVYWCEVPHSRAHQFFAFVANRVVTRVEVGVDPPAVIGVNTHRRRKEGGLSTTETSRVNKLIHGPLLDNTEILHARSLLVLHTSCTRRRRTLNSEGSRARRLLLVHDLAVCSLESHYAAVELGLGKVRGGAPEDPLVRN